MITENLSTLKIHQLTQDQYDRALAAGNIDQNALYLTPEEPIMEATQEFSGLMSASDKQKIDGIADNANNYKLPIASVKELGGIKSGQDISINANGMVSVVGGQADSLTIDAGSYKQPVYFVNGIPQIIDYTIEASVPSGAKFTDTTYSAAGTKLGLVQSGGSVTIHNGIIWVDDNSHEHSNYLPTDTRLNGLPLMGNLNLEPQDIDAVPVYRTINGQDLSTDIVLRASDVNAVSNNIQINGKNLNSDVWLDPEDVGAAPIEHTQAADTITEGTLGGQVQANESAMTSLSTPQVRNIYIGSTDMTASTTSLATGSIYFRYI